MKKEKHLIFSWLGELYAAPMNSVIEVMDLESMVKTSREELKVTLWKKRSMPVLDPLALMTIEETKATKETRVVLTEVRDLKVGFLVDKVIGIEELDMGAMKEPGISEKRFVQAINKQFKIVDLSHFVNEEISNLIKKAYGLNINVILDGDRLMKARMNEREMVLDRLKLESLNFLIESSRKNLDSYYVNGIMRLHKMIEQI